VKRYRYVIGIVGLFFLLFPFLFKNPFHHHVMFMLFLYGILAGAWNVIGGYGGQLSFGHALYFGIGAYLSTFLFATFHLTPWIGIILAVLASSFAGFLAGLPFFRLRGHYFAIGTIGFTEAARAIIKEWQLVGGAVGIYIPLIPSSLVDFQWSSRIPYYYIGYAFLILVLLVNYKVENSKLGYYLRAVKMNESAALSLGVNPLKYKEIAMMISCGFSGLAGVLYAQYTLYVHPVTVFALNISVDMAIIALVGGAGTVFGPLIGAIILIPLNEILKIHIGETGPLHIAVFGVVVMMVAIFQPSGIIVYLRRLLEWRLPAVHRKGEVNGTS
jgi:branched-chain amino acid transport system permease protein